MIGRTRIVAGLSVGAALPLFAGAVTVLIPGAWTDHSSPVASASGGPETDGAPAFLSPPAGITELETAFASVAERVQPTVVQIDTEGWRGGDGPPGEDGSALARETSEDLREIDRSIPAGDSFLLRVVQRDGKSIMVTALTRPA